MWTPQRKRSLQHTLIYLCLQTPVGTDASKMHTSAYLADFQISHVQVYKTCRMNTCFLIQKHAEHNERFFTFASLPTDSLVHRDDFVLHQCSLVFITVINMRVMIQSGDVSSWLPTGHFLFAHTNLIHDRKLLAHSENGNSVIIYSICSKPV